MPKEPRYTLSPGYPTPGRSSLLRPPIASAVGTGILTCFPSGTRFRLPLGADSPCVDERCAGNLGLTASGPFTRFIATHVSIRTSDASRPLHRDPSQAYGTLSYRVSNPLKSLHVSRALPPSRLDREKGALASAAAVPLRPRLGVWKRRALVCARRQATSGGLLTPRASVTGLSPENLPRRTTRSVSYYAFFKGWLLLSQPPDCLCLPTSFAT